MTRDDEKNDGSVGAEEGARRYHMQEMELMLPSELVDQTVNVFVITPDGPSDYTVVINRAALEEGGTLERYVDEQVTTLRKSVARFDLRLRETIEVGGREAISLESQWAQDNVPIEQRQVVVGLGGRVLMLTLTAKGRIRPKWWRAFEEMLESISFRDGVGGVG